MSTTEPDPETEFRELLMQVRAGDALAAEQLVKEYEAEIRRTIRLRLTDVKLRRLVDTMDICQSVMAHFFVHVAHGQFDLQSPKDLVRVLVSMVRNKVIDQTRREQAQRRDARRSVADDDTALNNVVSAQTSPASSVANQDLVNAIRERFSERERQIADARTAGQSWPEIARDLGIDEDAARKMFTRALDRIASELRIEDLR